MLRTVASFLLPLLALAVGLVPISAQPAKPKKYALLIGINKYNHANMNKPKALEFAERDIASAKDLFEKAGYEVDVLLGEKATLKAIRHALDNLANKGSADGVVVVGFAGHGVQPDGGAEAYYCPFDTGMRVAKKNGKPVLKDGKRVIECDPDSMLPLTEALTALKLSPAGARLLLADCCRNDPATGRGAGVGTGLKLGDLPDNTAVLLACSRGQKAYEDKAWGEGHGAFFYHALDGMRGKAADKNGRITGRRLADHLEDTVPDDVAKVKKGGAEQKPFCLTSGKVDLQLTLAVSEPKAGEERSFEIADGVKMVFCYIPAGEAQLGSPKAEREAAVKDRGYGKLENWVDEAEGLRGKYKTKGFWLGKYEVTQAEWKAVMGDNPSFFVPTEATVKKANITDTGRFPVERVSWDDICTGYKKGDSFLAKLNKRGGIVKVFGKVGKFRLPHEDEWEYAYRGGKGNGRVYYWGDAMNGTEANCNGHYPFGTATKGQHLGWTCAVDDTNDGKYAKHPWGLQHMSGNVYEWCDNKYSNEDTRLLRGGSWISGPGNCRAAYRYWDAPAIRLNFIGFRVCFRLD